MTDSGADSSLLALFGLPDKIAIVTGAGAGIGKAIAQVLAKAGARVVVADINVDAARTVADGINSGRSGASAAALAAQVDIADEKSVVRLFELTGETFGGIDVLVNNAGIYEHTPFLDTPVEKVQRVLAVNTVGTYLCMREAIKRMRSGGKGGAIVNISSAASLAPVIFDNNDYGASKAGVNNLTQTAALEFAPDQIRVNAVLPGGVATERALSSVSHKPARGPMTQPGRFPLGRMATPEDIAMAVLFLASPAAAYITGQLLAVDGGFQVS
ncbi:MAG: SDR family NAD(P)-dependent oxidoreductase [Steroidobacteraceae bacterium]